MNRNKRRDFTFNLEPLTLNGRRSSAGFTLVELLVTIGIIAMLAALLLPVVNIAIEKAEIAKAQTEMANISSAIRGYYKEYGLMPCHNNGYRDHTFLAKGSPSGKTQDEVMDILRDVETDYNRNHTNNSHRIVFLEVPVQAMTGEDKDGNTYTEDDGYYLDPWENPYMICMDTDFDGEIGVAHFDGEPAAMAALTEIAPIPPYNDNGVRTFIFPAVTIGVMSYGPDPDDPESFMVSWGTGQ
jgi:prepilin-type N-terminal cleavage/methylation domain-containing protein